MRNPFKKSRLYYYYWVFERSLKKGKLLDYGCNTGEFIASLQTSKSVLYGFDVNKEVVKLAKRKHKGIKFYCGKVDSKLPYKSNFFNEVYLLHVLEHVPSEDAVIKEIHRVLRKNGTFFLASPYRGVFAWADAANLRYFAPGIHKIFAEIFYGKRKYKELFIKGVESNLFGDSSIGRTSHYHYSEKEIRKILQAKFKIETFVKYSLFQPFLLTLINIWKLLFKRKNFLFELLVKIDNRIRFENLSYNFIVVAKKK